PMANYGNQPGWIYATSINNAGRVTGYGTAPGSIDHVFLYTKAGGVKDIGGEIGERAFINNSGVVIANRYINGFGNLPDKYENGHGSTILSMNWVVGGISDSGYIAGSTGSTSPSEKAFLYKDGTSILIGSLGGSTTNPAGVNNAGHLAGESQIAGN